MQIRGHESVAHHAHVLDRIGGLRYHRQPVAAQPVVDVDRDHARARSLEVRLDEEGGAEVVHERVRRLEVVDELDDGSVDHRLPRVVEVDVVEPVPCVRPLPHGDHRVATVLRDRRAEAPIGFVGALVDEHVLRLRPTHHVVVQLLMLVHRQERVLALRRVVARIEEAAVVLRPRRLGELHPFEGVDEILARGHVAHADLLPVGAARRHAVREMAAVVARLEEREGDRAVARERVRVEQHVTVLVELALHVQHGLVL